MAGRGRGVDYNGGGGTIRGSTYYRGGGRGRPPTSTHRTPMKKVVHVFVDEDLTLLNSKLDWVDFPLNQAETVRVVEASSPSSSFFVRSKTAQSQFEKMAKEVKTVVECTNLVGNVLCQPRTTLVLSPLKDQDEGYWRAEVLKHDRGTGMLTLFYSDIGKVAEASRDVVIKLPDSLERIPRLITQCQWDRAVAEEVNHPASFKSLLQVGSSLTLTATHKIVPGQFLVSLEGFKSQATFSIHSHPSDKFWMQELKDEVPEPESEHVEKIGAAAAELVPNSAPAPIDPADGGSIAQQRPRHRPRHRDRQGQPEAHPGPFALVLPPRSVRIDTGAESPPPYFSEEARQRVVEWERQIPLEVCLQNPFSEPIVMDQPEVRTPSP